MRRRPGPRAAAGPSPGLSPQAGRGGSWGRLAFFLPILPGADSPDSPPAVLRTGSGGGATPPRCARFTHLFRFFRGGFWRGFRLARATACMPLRPSVRVNPGRGALPPSRGCRVVAGGDRRGGEGLRSHLRGPQVGGGRRPGAQDGASRGPAEGKRGQARNACFCGLCHRLHHLLRKEVQRPRGCGGIAYRHGWTPAFAQFID